MTATDTITDAAARHPASRPEARKLMATTQRTRKGRAASAAAGSSGVAGYPAERLVRLFRKMTEIRFFEEACHRAFRQGKIGGYLHTYIGEEAVAAAFLEAGVHQPGDKIITAYRDHAHALLLGATPNEVMAELYGKGTGLVQGKGGSMHLFDAKNDFMGGYGIVGGHIPLGVGFAYAQAYQNSGKITQLYLGDGAIHNGAFHEAANLAGLWGRDGLNPCLFILENNQYGMGTSIERATANTDLGSKFASYGIEYEKVDGMDLEAVIEVAERTTRRVRETNKPYAVEAITYRIAPHGAADFLEKYRTKEEVAQARERDPLTLLEAKLLETGKSNEAEIAEIRAESKVLIDAAVRFAEESPEPPLDSLWTDVYAEA
jgi:pyruvate dehydrogenase E1 component alpha subunit